MGDRGNIGIKQQGGAVIYLYTHWRGYEVNEILAAALNRGRERWTDPDYLARIIFDELTRGQHDREDGFGISTRVADNNYPIPIVDTERQIVNETPFEKYIQAYLETGPV